MKNLKTIARTLWKSPAFKISCCAILLLLAALAIRVLSLRSSALHRIQETPLSQCGNLTPASVPQTLAAGILAQEDFHFFEHRGVDWQALRHAFLQDLKKLKIISGASTVDMQVVSLCFLKDVDPRSIHSKILEIFGALALNERYPKKEILGAYIASVPLIQNSNELGFAAASQHYYKKPLKNLDRLEEWGLILTLRNREALNPEEIRANQVFLRQRTLKHLADSAHRQRILLTKEKDALSGIPYLYYRNLDSEEYFNRRGTVQIPSLQSLPQSGGK